MWRRKKEEEEPVAVVEEPPPPPPPAKGKYNDLEEDDAYAAQKKQQQQQEQEEQSFLPPHKKNPAFKHTPLKFEDLCRESKNVVGTQELFDGFKFDLQKNFSQDFGINHSIGMGSVLEPANYNFGTNVHLSNGATLLGRVDTEGNVQARITHDPMARFSYRVMAQASPEPHSSAVQSDLEFRGHTWNSSLRWANPGTFGLSYTQRVIPSLTLGLDTFYAAKQGISLLNGGFRFETDHTITTGILNTAQLLTSFSRKMGDRCTMSTELQLSWPNGNLETNYSVGVYYMLRTSHLKFHLDTQWKVSCYLEEMLNQYSRFMLSAELDHKKKNYRFGFGLGMNI